MFGQPHSWTLSCLGDLTANTCSSVRKKEAKHGLNLLCHPEGKIYLLALDHSLTDFPFKKLQVSCVFCVNENPRGAFKLLNGCLLQCGSQKSLKDQWAEGLVPCLGQKVIGL